MYRPLLIIFTLSIILPTVSLGNVLSGSMIYDQIVKKLEHQNLVSSPAINQARIFPACSSPVSIKSIFGSWKTVEVSCPNTNWTIKVRTNISKTEHIVSQIEHNDKSQTNLIVALKTSLNAGDVIEEEHISYLKTKKTIGGGIFYKKNQVVGRSLKRALSVGTVVRARHLEPNWIIKKNQIVTIEHKVGNILISARGIAQESGQIGQKIYVNNFNSGKKVLCRIKNDKKVTTNAKVY